MIDIEQITHPTLNGGGGLGLYLLFKSSLFECNTHSIPTRVHQLRNENQEKL